MLNFVRLLNNAILIIFLKRNNINYRFNKAKIKNMVLTIEINKEIKYKAEELGFEYESLKNID